MKTTDLFLALTELAERVSHPDRFLTFEAMRRLRHEGGYLVTAPRFAPPTPEMERFWGIR